MAGIFITIRQDSISHISNFLPLFSVLKYLNPSDFYRLTKTLTQVLT